MLEYRSIFYIIKTIIYGLNTVKNTTKITYWKIFLNQTLRQRSEQTYNIKIITKLKRIINKDGTYYKND